MLDGNEEFVLKYSVATKRVQRAILKDDLPFCLRPGLHGSPDG
jgi:hypothetical protein